MDRSQISPKDQGSALIIALIVMGLISVGMILCLQIGINTKRVAETAVADADMRLMVTQINTILQNEYSCRVALGGSQNINPTGTGPTGGSPYYGTPQAPQPITTPLPAAAKIPPAPGMQNSLLIYDGSLVYNANTVIFGGGSPFGKLSNVYLQLIQKTTQATSPFNGYNIYAGALVVTAQKSVATSATQLYGAQTMVSQDLTLAVVLDNNNNIVSCSSLVFQPAGGGNLQTLPVCGPGNSFYSDGTKITCVKTACLWDYTVLPWPDPPSNPPTYDAAGNIICN